MNKKEYREMIFSKELPKQLGRFIKIEFKHERGIWRNIVAKVIKINEKSIVLEHEEQRINARYANIISWKIPPPLKEFTVKSSYGKI
jgi:ribosome maturation factor RimP